MDAYNKAAGEERSRGFASAQGNRAGGAYSSILTGDQFVLAQRIGSLRRQRALGVFELEAAAGRLIDSYPHCPRHASRLVDRLTHARDLAIWEGRA